MNERNYKYSNDRVYVFKDIIFHLLKKWRSLIAAVVIGLAIGGLGYVMNSSQTSDDAASSNRTAEQLEEDVEIDDDLIADMELAYQYRLKYGNLLEYVSNSLYMQINPDEFYIGILSYYVSGTVEAYVAASIYQNIINEEGIYEELAEVSGLDCDPKYLYEMISVSITTGGAVYSGEDEAYSTPTYTVVTFTINSVDEESCTAMTDLLRDKVDEVTETASKEYEYNLTKLADSVNEVSDDAYQSNQSTYIANLYTYRTNYTNLESDFSDEEYEYYETVYLNAGESADETEADDEAASEAVSRIDIKSLVKWVIIGEALCVIIWGLWHVCRYILIGYIGGSIAVSRTYNLPIIGRVEGVKGACRGIDAAIGKLNSRFKERPDEVAYVIDTVQSFEGGKAVLSGDIRMPEAGALVEGAGNLSAENILVMEWSNKNFQAMEASKETGYEIIVVVEDKTTHSDIRRELECCSVNGIKVLGFICVEG